MVVDVIEKIYLGTERNYEVTCYRETDGRYYIDIKSTSARESVSLNEEEAFDLQEFLDRNV